jgi:CRISPR-associated protein Csm3
MDHGFEFQGKYLVSGLLLAETGLRVGGMTEGIEIGGVDNPVIRDPLSGRPYIPGSSLKGKLRHLLEWTLGRVAEHPDHSKPGKPVFTAHFCGECDACIMFGPSSDKDEVRVKAGPSRLIVRDAFPTPETVRLWDTWLGERVYTELKNENYLDRVTSEASPRTMERVPAGSKFAFQIIMDTYEGADRDRLAQVFRAMYLLENSALGGSGSRGHGQVKFTDLNVVERPKSHYLAGAAEAVRFAARSHPEQEYPKRPSHHQIVAPKAGEIDFEKSLPQYLAEQWAILRG